MNLVYLKIGIVLGLIASGYFFLRGRKNVQMFGPLAQYHTKRYLPWLDKIANISPRFWRGFGTVGIVVGFFWMILLSFSLVLNARNILTAPDIAPQAGATLAIPGITIPLVSGLIAIIIVVAVHEFSHGILARAQKLRVKTMGTLSLGFLPLGAFVQPDDEQVKRKPLLVQLRVFAAGSFMNIVFATVILLLISFVVLPGVTQPVEGAKLLGVTEGTPAEAGGLQAGMQLIAIDGMATPVYEDFLVTLLDRKLEAGDDVTFKTAAGETFTLTAAEREGRGFLGITFCGQYAPRSFFLISFFNPFFMSNGVNPACYPIESETGASAFWLLYGTFVWIVGLNIGIGIANLLPIKPLDGGLMVEALVKKVTKPQLTKRIMLAVSLFVFFALLINLFPGIFT